MTVFEHRSGVYISAHEHWSAQNRHLQPAGTVLMGDVINLRHFRKQKSREDKQRRAEENRVVHGETRADRKRREAEAENTVRLLDSHRRAGAKEEPDEPA
jgi:hypothetical protein